ncbi:dUTP diphosphatase [Brachybacterium saurashtrense]|uniref:dUTP diphosphatase n=1 Tax=Brachybacterium saurashtrense TaxID=556288 RepID=A0A345YM33_9MICO|nr:dUTP diphosphatase [Brachybacterium saurashtrense]AXK44985.1 dUTP diphosphatase [Brachybacterium saurashtrense]RRR21669.1 dUTP diphosphatase [Brachybacterium saurashtrense]
MPVDSADPRTEGGGPVPASDVPVLRLRRRAQVPMPHRAHPDDAGLDLASAEELVIPAGGRALVDTGLAVALPPGTVGMVCPRSGLAARHGVTVLNGPGIVDAGYRGPVKVALHNTDPTEPFALGVGDRIAQLVVVPFLAPPLVEVEDLEETARAGSGFGSSGGFGTASATTAADETTEG